MSPSTTDAARRSLGRRLEDLRRRGRDPRLRRRCPVRPRHGDRVHLQGQHGQHCHLRLGDHPGQAVQRTARSSASPVGQALGGIRKIYAVTVFVKGKKCRRGSSTAFEAHPLGDQVRPSQVSGTVRRPQCQTRGWKRLASPSGKAQRCCLMSRRLLGGVDTVGMGDSGDLSLRRPSGRPPRELCGGRFVSSPEPADATPHSVDLP